MYGHATSSASAHPLPPLTRPCKKNQVVPAASCPLPSDWRVEGQASAAFEFKHVSRCKAAGAITIAVVMAEAVAVITVFGIEKFSESFKSPTRLSISVFVCILLAIALAAAIDNWLSILRKQHDQHCDSIATVCANAKTQLNLSHGVQSSSESDSAKPNALNKINSATHNDTKKVPHPSSKVCVSHGVNIHTRIQDIDRYLREHLSALIPKDEDSEGTEIPDVLSAAVEAVNDVMSALQMTKNLLAPSVGFLENMDKETERWFMHEVCASNYGSGEEASVATDKEFYRIVTQRVKRAMSFTKLPKLLGDKEPHGSKITALKSMLDSALNFDFDVFNFTKFADERPVCVLGFFLFKHYDLIKLFNIEIDCLINFLNKVEDEHCPNNPYHDSTHGADMLQAMHYFLTSENLRSRVSPIEILATLIACMFRNIGHPGVTEHFLLASKSKLSLLHNNRSCLENHAASVGMAILREDEYNILANATKTQQTAVTEIVIELILSMDLKHHFEFVSDLKTRFFVGNGNVKNCFSASDPRDRLGLLTLALKCADIAYTVKSTSIHLQWVRLIVEEQYAQGDLEKQHNLQVGPFNDRTHKNFAKSQSNFIEYLATPLIEMWAMYLENPELVHRLKVNLEHWTVRSNTEERDEDTRWRCGHGASKSDSDWEYESSDEEAQLGHERHG